MWSNQSQPNRDSIGYATIDRPRLDRFKAAYEPKVIPIEHPKVEITGGKKIVIYGIRQKCFGIPPTRIHIWTVNNKGIAALTENIAPLKANQQAFK